MPTTCGPALHVCLSVCAPVLIRSSVTRLGDFCTLGNFFEPLATTNLPKYITFLGNFCKGIKMYHFSSETIFGQLLHTFGDFYLVTLIRSLFLRLLFAPLPLEPTWNFEKDFLMHKKASSASSLTSSHRPRPKRPWKGSFEIWNDRELRIYFFATKSLWKSEILVQEQVFW